MSRRIKLLSNAYIWLLLITIVSYWPVAFQFFSVKNDNAMVFLAFRYNIIEAIQNGHLPLWSPYINLGFPVHADIQSGAWNPVVWFFSLFGRYTLSSMHMETILYIFLGGAGMFRLLKQFVQDKNISIGFATAYLLSGYFCDVAGNNILFLAGAAFTPWVLSYGLAIYRQRNFQNAIALAVSFYFLFSASYPFFTVVTGYILAISFLYRIGINVIQKNTKEVFISLKFYATSAGVFLLIAAPALYSYLQFLPEYSRGNQISLQRSNENHFELTSLISYLFPNAPLKNMTIVSDLTMRNAYIGLIPLVLIFAWVFIKNKTRKEWWIFSGMTLALLFALGNILPVHRSIFNFVPLLDHFRHPANARLFFSIAALVLSAMTCIKIRNHQSSSRIFKITAAFLATSILIFLCTLNGQFYDDAFSYFKYFSISDRDNLKQTLQNLNEPFYIFSNAVIQIFFLALLSLLNYSSWKRRIIFLTFINSFIFLQFCMPVTEVNKLSPLEGNQLLNNYSKGFPAPALKETIFQNSKTDSSVFIRIGHQMFYNKKIGFPSVNYNPTILNNIDSLTKNQNIFNKIMQQPFAFITGKDSSAEVSITEFNNNRFVFTTKTKDSAVLHIQQTFTKNWFARIDDEAKEILKSDIAFMAISLKRGTHKISLVYHPPYIITLLAVAATTFAVCCTFLFVTFIRKNLRRQTD